MASGSISDMDIILMIKAYEFTGLDEEQCSSFYISDEDQMKIEDWDKEHSLTCEYVLNPMKGGAIGGRLEYSFIPTGLGNITEVKCICGEKFNFTNFDNW